MSDTNPINGATAPEQELLSVRQERKVLIVEDEFINREILMNCLEPEYGILCAETDEAAREIIHANFDTLSLILLDLNLPDGHGLDILRWLRGDAQLFRIPVIVMTSDRESEVESLDLGAIDFISKPYPMPEVIRARVRRVIELTETKDLIRETSRDHLTGLYNREYFFHYAEQYDQFHRDEAMDALVLRPLFDLGMRLGEGSGCPLAMMLLDAACAVMNDMATFGQAGIDDSYLETIQNTDAFTVKRP